MTPRPAAAPGGASWAAMRAAAERLGIDPGNAELVSRSSREIWHLPQAEVALVVAPPGTRTLGQAAAEAMAVRAATDAGVHTPALLAGPTALPNDGIALAYRWVALGRPADASSWPLLAAEASRLATASVDDLPVVSLTLGVPSAACSEVLGAALAGTLANAWERAVQLLAVLLREAHQVLAHGDLHPNNMLMAGGNAWLIDFEHACRAPAEWDPAKIVILGRRFGEPHQPKALLGAWGPLDPGRLAACVQIQEALIVGWLVRMATRGTPGAANEARRRAAGLAGGGPAWRHLA